MSRVASCTFRGSACGAYAGFGVAPKRSFLEYCLCSGNEARRKFANPRRLRQHARRPHMAGRQRATRAVSPHSQGRAISKSPRRLESHRSLFLHLWLTQPLARVSHYLLNQGRMWPWEKKQILRTVSGSERNDEILGKKFWLVTHHRALQIDRMRKGSAVLARDKHQLARLFVCGDERTGKICWNAPAAAADARRSPGDCFAKNIFVSENGCEPGRQRDRQFHRH